MKSRRFVAALLVVVLMVVPLVPYTNAVSSSGRYAEKLTIYVAGSSAFWTLQLTGINATNGYLTRLESISGVYSYNVTGIKTSNWASDFQVFGSQGYNLVPLPFLPLEGLFFKVNASGYSEASSAAQVLDGYFATEFASYSNESSIYTFFAPVSFNTLMPSTLMRYIPVKAGGFVSALNYQSPSSPGNFTGVDGPVITLSGSRSSSGVFSHSLTLSGFASKALSSSDSPALLGYFGSSISYLAAANTSTSSSIVVRALNGIITGTNTTGITNNMSLFTGSYSMSLSPGEKVRSINVSVVQQPPQLLVTRSEDAGTLASGQTVSMTLTVQNLSNSTTVNMAAFSDNWWQSYGFFKLLAGNSTISASELAPGKVMPRTYELQYTGTANTTQQVTIPPATVSYSFVTTNPATGAATNSSITLYSSVNGALLLVGSDVREPVLYSYLETSSGINGAVGSTQNLKLVVQNVGTRTADNVTVNGQLVGALQAGATLPTSAIPVTAPSLTSTNVTERYTVSYLTPELKNVTLTTNTLHVLFPQAIMRIAFVTLAVNSTTVAVGKLAKLTLSFDTIDNGLVNATSFVAQGSLPTGMACGKASTTALTCSDGVVRLSYTNMSAVITEDASMSFNLTQPENYIMAPFTYVTNSSGYSMSGESNGIPIPAGLSLSKTFTPAQVFEGMHSGVSLLAQNNGPYPIYNATIATSADTFASTLGGVLTGTTNKTTVNVGKSLSYGYNVSISATMLGNQTAQAVTASFFFGGSKFSTKQTQSTVVIYKPLAATIVSMPATPVEGKKFSIEISITNPSPLTVSDVGLSLPIPPEIHVISLQNATVSKGDILVNVTQLGGNRVYTANVTASSSSGVSVPFSGSKYSLVFSYEGQAVKGSLPSGGIAINEDVLTRYILPIGLALVVLLAVAVFLRRMAAPSAPASQQ